ncbi:flagellar motor protein MotB [Anaerosporomusa subterranea]|jgi:chemotaxis protein MotB|uniref:Flagellar motor protein MotB n=1 Tax=Anaerosporomusa subterranea TaxID=1794912 RepID=A0A154BMM7_ANASB|nr:flagellar motor protein MotB [Anaerosporomusa subterranea]KYZ75237.1 flagellar motor protein MotB [Anaerosporomusa subterranea]MDF2500765.1 Motility protein N-terminal domain containing protein [Anaerosporomusa subterranea]
MAKKKHQEHHEEHADESWLIPYADILTLLLALFIVLFSSAQVDAKKFEQIRASFGSAFGAGTNSLMPESRSAPTVIAGPPESPQQMEAINPADNKQQQYVRETAQLLEVKRALDTYIQQNNLTGDLNTMLTGDGLMLRIRDSALFPSGSAELLPESRRLGGEIAKLLLAVPQKVMISGHTDTVPINTAEFPSNWELSSKRSLNFMRFILSQQSQLDPARFNATGHGEYRPVSPNTSPEGQAKNRRVEVLILRQYRQ